MSNSRGFDPARRRLLQAGVASGAALLPAGALRAAGPVPVPALPPAIQKLQPVTPKVVPITVDERRARIAKAQRLMGEAGVDALFVGAGSSLAYFTGIRWGNSERLTAMLLPREGEPVYVAPEFERERTLEQIRFGTDVRGWQEHEDPYRLVGQVLKEFGAGTGRVAVEEMVPFFRVRGLARASPNVDFVEARDIVARCREVKSPAELALMKLANETTLAVYEAVWRSIEPGMTQFDVNALLQMAYARTGLAGGASINVGEFTALPHGSSKPQVIVEGTPVIFDGGCKADGYTSDITRTVVVGEPTDKMRRVFDIVLKAQTAVARAARPGMTHGSLDAIARRVIADAGYGADYQHFTHRLGHGIGLDMHEWDYLVRGNSRVLEPGMTFSDEPGIYIPGQFGVRLEDILYITEDAAGLMTPQSPSLDAPFG